MTYAIGILATLLVLAGLAAGLYGAGEFTAATFGVGLVAFGCFWLILARIAQASAYEHAARERHRDLVSAIKDGTSPQV